MKTLQKVTLAIALITLFSSCQSGSDIKQVLAKPEARKEIMDSIANNNDDGKSRSNDEDDEGKSCNDAKSDDRYDGSM